MHHHHISQWHWAGKLCFTYTTATLLFLDYVRCNLILLHILFICLCSPEELSPIENKRSPDTREACVLCIPALACPALCVFLSPSTLFGALETKKKKTSPEDKLWTLWVCLALLSIGFLYPDFPVVSFGIWLVVPLVPPFCDVIFVQQVFQSQEKESENGGVCLNAWLSLIPWLNCPLPWSQCIVVYAQILRRKVTFVWPTGSPPQRTNPAELVHSATTSWPGGIWPLKWLQKECLSPLQRIFFFHKVKVTHRVSYSSSNSVWSPRFHCAHWLYLLNI